MITYEDIILGCWVAFVLVWAVSAFNTKRDIQGGDRGAWRKFALLRWMMAAMVLVFVISRAATGTAHFANSGRIFSLSIFPQPMILDWIAAALSVAGVCFAIWARVRLGRNWSSRPAVKMDHELVTSGPYAYVRHPIYTGLILMAAGTALTGSAWGIGVFVIACFVLLSRIPIEEKIMLELFPKEYPGYKERTKRLVPFIW